MAGTLGLKAQKKNCLIVAKEKQARPSVKKKKKVLAKQQITTFLLETKQTPQNMNLLGQKVRAGTIHWKLPKCLSITEWINYVFIWQ